MIIFKTTLGDIKIELNFDKAPITAKNFQQYVEEGQIGRASCRERV